MADTVTLVWLAPPSAPVARLGAVVAALRLAHPCAEPAYDVDSRLGP